MLDEAIINLTKGEVYAKRGEWVKSYACYSKSLEFYKQISQTNFEIAQPMISECNAQMKRVSRYIKNGKIGQPEALARTSPKKIHTILDGSQSIPESTISNILSRYENVSSAEKKIQELEEIEVCESPPLLDESFCIVKPIGHTIEKMQRLVFEKNKQIEELKKSYSTEFKHLKKAMEQLTENDALIFRDEMINKYTALKEHLTEKELD